MVILFLIILGIFAILFLVYLFFAAIFIFDIFLPAPYVSSKKEVVGKMIKVAEIAAGDKVLDLGSGDGRVLIAAAKAGAEAVGVEKNPFLVLFSKIKAKLARVSVKILYGDIFSQDLKSADVIFLYLNPKLLVKLSLKLRKEAKTGTRVISNGYEIPSFTPITKTGNIFLYKIKKY